eukprot:EG_transcript_25063
MGDPRPDVLQRWWAEMPVTSKGLGYAGYSGIYQSVCEMLHPDWAADQRQEYIKSMWRQDTGGADVLPFEGFAAAMHRVAAEWQQVGGSRYSLAQHLHWLYLDVSVHRAAAEADDVAHQERLRLRQQVYNAWLCTEVRSQEEPWERLHAEREELSSVSEPRTPLVGSVEVPEGGSPPLATVAPDGSPPEDPPLPKRPSLSAFGNLLGWRWGRNR